MDLARHPWNRGFTWQEHTGPFECVSTAQAAQLDELGYFVVADAFDRQTLDELDAALASGDDDVKRFLERAPGGRFSVAGLDTQTVAPHAVTRSECARRFCAHPMLAGIAHDLVGPDVRLYWDQSVYKQPGSAEPVLWHQDTGYTYVEPQSYLTCWVAITDATTDNGCIAVMPGLHRRGTLAHRSTPIGEECWGDWSAAVEVPVRAGSIVVFSSLTPHATKENRTDAVRKAYIVQYAPEGAVALHGDPNAGPPTGREVLGDDERRFWIVRDGAPVEPAAAT
jgi:ectoine hydroxylase-related dioxygenase (phytanoyl-CoA dioxygenase family)